MITRVTTLNTHTSGSAITVPPSPRRVLLVDHTASLGGGELALLGLVRHLDTTRFYPLVVLGSDGPLREKLEAAQIETHILPLSSNIVDTRKDALGGKTMLRLRAMCASVAYTRQLARFIRKNRIDLVHTNSLKADILGGVAARWCRRPLIWHIRDRIEPDYLPPSVVRVFRWLSGVLPTFVVANSQATLQTLHLPARKAAQAVYSGIEMPPATPFAEARASASSGPGFVASEVSPETQTLASAAEPEADNPPAVRLGLVGRISPWKGQHIFLQAAAQVRQRFPQAQFQIIGSALFDEAAYDAEIHALSTSLGLDDCVEFLGFRNDVPELIAGLDILVHASTTGEPFGQVVVQGMAAGKPVVATRGGGVPEIVIEGETGLLVTMGSVEEMAQAILTLLADPARARRMGECGRERVLKTFTVQQTTRDMEAVYAQLCPPAAPRSQTVAY